MKETSVKADLNLATAIFRSAGMAPRQCLKSMQAEGFLQDYHETLNPTPNSTAALQFIKNGPDVRLSIPDRAYKCYPEDIVDVCDLFINANKSKFVEFAASVLGLFDPEDREQGPDPARETMVACNRPVSVNGYPLAVCAFRVTSTLRMTAHPSAWKMVVQTSDFRFGKAYALAVMPLSALFGVEFGSNYDTQ